MRMNPRDVSRLNGGNWRRRRWRRRCWFVCLLTDERQLCSFISCRPTQKLRCARKAFACDQLFLQLCLLRPPFAYVNNKAKIAVIACFCRQMLRIRTDSTAPKFIVRIRSIGADCRLAYGIEIRALCAQHHDLGSSLSSSSVNRMHKHGFESRRVMIIAHRLGRHSETALLHWQSNRFKAFPFHLAYSTY